MWLRIADIGRRFGTWVRGLNGLWRLVELCLAWPFFMDHLVIARTNNFDCADLRFSFVIQINISVAPSM
jgi:hypothetical protein